MAVGSADSALPAVCRGAGQSRRLAHLARGRIASVAGAVALHEGPHHRLALALLACRLRPRTAARLGRPRRLSAMLGQELAHAAQIAGDRVRSPLSVPTYIATALDDCQQYSLLSTL